MNILNDIVSGASRQFGREFGRAGANVILKGSNSYTIRGISDYSGRIKPSDSQVIKTIKEIQKMIKSEIIYFADQKSYPYGTKSQAQLQKIIEKSIRLLQKNFSPEYIVVANKTNEHIKTLIELKKIGFKGNILIEKPLSHNLLEIPDKDFNNVFVGKHEGFFAPFEFDVIKYAHKGKNTLLVKVINEPTTTGSVDDKGEHTVGNKIYAAGGLGYDEPIEGWHICPPAMGIYQDCYLEARATLFVSDVFVRPMTQDSKAEVWLEIFNTENKRS